MRAWLPLAAILGAGLHAAPAAAYELQRTKSGHEVRWEGESIDLAIDPSLVAVAYGTADALRDAARTWSGAGGAPLVGVSNGAGKDAIGDVGRNVAFFVPGGYAPAKGALAITVVTFDDAGGRILDADIVVSGAYRFGVLDAEARGGTGKAVPNDLEEPTSDATRGGGAPGDTFDLGHVLAHEMGHLLGLADARDDPGAIMYRMTAPNDAGRRAPNGNDLAGVRALYGSNAKGCGGASVSPAPPDAGAGHAAMPLAFAAALWLAARGRPRTRAALAVCLALFLLARTPRIAAGERRAVGQAQARVVASHVVTPTRGPLLATRLTLAIEECRVARCPPRAEVLVWGGSRGGVTQVVGHAPAPAAGDVVELALVDAPLSPALGPAFFGAR